MYYVVYKNGEPELVEDTDLPVILPELEKNAPPTPLSQIDLVCIITLLIKAPSPLPSQQNVLMVIETAKNRPLLVRERIPPSGCFS